MNDFIIGDEEFAEEINTSYDQDKDITDLPSAYFGVSGQPIEARNGQGFMDINRLGESHECKTNDDYCVCETCDTDSDEYHNMSCKTCKRTKGFLYGEKLNKDGTGVARAVRGLDPRNYKHTKMMFDYVSKAGCKICSQYDGKVFERNDEKRPVIPRLESAGWSARPYTHPNCKCRWVKVGGESYYPPSDAYKECKYCGERFWYDSHSINAENTAIHVKDKHEEKYHQTKLNSDENTSNEVDEKTLARARKWYGDGFDELGSLDQKMVVINMLKKSIGMEVKIIALESEPSAYGIQNMLDIIVAKALNKEEKQDIIDNTKDENFSLEKLLDMIADKLVNKLSKKLGVESYNKHRCPKCDEEFNTNDEVITHMLTMGHGENFGDIKDSVHTESYGGESVTSWWESLNENKRGEILGKYHLLTGTEDGHDYDELSENAQDKIFELYSNGYATEGGKGSGKSGHSPWMLGTYVADECPNCMICTERNNGICTICGK